jgi:beta-mannanase
MIDRIRPTLALAAGLSLALLIVCLPAPALAGSKGPRPSYWGAWLGSQLTGVEPPADMSAVSSFEQLVGKSPSLIEISSPFADCTPSRCDAIDFPATGMQRIREYGAIPVLSWSSFQSGDGGNAPQIPLAALNAGAYDSYIRHFAESVRAWGHPFFLRFDWEMNGSWMPWTEGVNGNQPGEYVSAYRHVHDIFTAAGATNASWVWCPYADPRKRFLPLRGLYPGARYVDWTCIDAFNWGPNPTNPVPWMSFEAIFDSTYRRITTRIAPHKPVMIAELGSTGTDRAKARWIRRIFQLFASRYRRVRAVIWFERVDRGVDWPLEGHPAAARAFAEGVRRAYRPSVYSQIAEQPIRPPGRATRSPRHRKHGPHRSAAARVW